MNISTEDLELTISAMENEITELTGKLKAKRTELKKLKKALIAAAKKAEEDKATILATIEESGKSVEEVWKFSKATNRAINEKSRPWPLRTGGGVCFNQHLAFMSCFQFSVYSAVMQGGG